MAASVRGAAVNDGNMWVWITEILVNVLEFYVMW